MQFWKQWPELSNKVHSQGRRWANWSERPVLPCKSPQLHETDSRRHHPPYVYTALWGIGTHFFSLQQLWAIIHIQLTHWKCTIRGFWGICRAVQPSPQPLLEHPVTPKRNPALTGSHSPFARKPLIPRHHLSTFCLYGTASLGHFSEMESYNTWPFVPGFFHSARWFRDSRRSWHGSVLHLFRLLNSIVLYEYTTFCYPFISWWTFGLFSYIGYYNSAAVSMSKFLWQYDFSSLENTSTTGTSGAYGDSV